MSFILQEILSPRPETPLLDDIATPEQLNKLEEDRKKTDDILEEWRTSPGSPWERDPEQMFDASSHSWDTDDVAIPDSWDEGEETAEEVNAQASTEESQTEKDEKSEDSLPELDSDEADTTEDSGYVFLNMPPSTEDEDPEADKKIKEEEKETLYKGIDNVDKEAQLEESTIDFILNMENPNYKEPEPCTGLTCPLTGEQYYVD